MSEVIYPDCYVEVWRRARKAHTCVECQRQVAPGERYRCSSGIWEGAPARYKHCAECAWIWDQVNTSRRSSEEAPEFGGLYEYIELYRGVGRIFEWQIAARAGLTSTGDPRV
jgi:glycerol kinase